MHSNTGFEEKKKSQRNHKPEHKEVLMMEVHYINHTKSRRHGREIIAKKDIINGF